MTFDLPAPYPDTPVLLPTPTAEPADHAAGNDLNAPDMVSEEISDRGLGCPHETSGALQFTADQLSERNRRFQVLEAVRVFLEENPGAPVAAACRAAGVDQATYMRWRGRYKEHGLDGLVPRTDRCGRKPSFDAFAPEAQQKLVQLYVRTGSQALALQLFRDDPLCPEPLKAWIDERNSSDKSRHQIPPSLRQRMQVTPAIHDKFRGPRRYELNAITTLRSMEEQLDGGDVRSIEPGDWWEMDDMSVNLPFWYESPFGTDKLAERHGVGIGRQSLCAMDIASGKWLGFELIGRPRDAYRAEDILRFLRRLFTEYGLPRRGLRLERGIWQSKRMTGYTVSDSGAAEGPVERPGMDEQEKERVVGGLQALGIEIRYVHTPKAKGFIESGFNFLQSVMAAIAHK